MLSLLLKADCFWLGKFSSTWILFGDLSHICSESDFCSLVFKELCEMYKDRNVRRLGCTGLSGIHHRGRWRYFLEIKFIFVTKVNILLGICQKLIGNVGSPQALIFIIFGLESWAYSDDSGTRGSRRFMQPVLLLQSTVRPRAGSRRAAWGGCGPARSAELPGTVRSC